MAILLPVGSIPWGSGGLTHDDVASLRRSGMDLAAFEAPIVTLAQRPNGAQLHHLYCSRVRHRAANTVTRSVLELAGAPLHRECFRFDSPLPAPVESLLRTALTVAAVLDGLATLDAEAGPDTNLALRARLASYLPALTIELRHLRQLEQQAAAGPLLSEEQERSLLARCETAVAAGYQRDAEPTMLAAAAIEIGRWPSVASLRTAGVTPGSGAGARISELWQRVIDTLSSGKGWARAAGAFHGELERNPVAGLDSEALLAAWKDELAERAEFGHTPILVGIHGELRGEVGTLVTSSFRRVPARKEAMTRANVEAFVTVLPEVLAERAVRVHPASVVWFGPAAGHADELADLIAAVWTKELSPARCYELACSLCHFDPRAPA